MSPDVAEPTPSPATSTLLPSRELYNKAVRRDLSIAVPVLVVVVASQLALQWRQSSRADDGSAEAYTWLIAALLVAGAAFIVFYYRALLKNTRIELGASSLTVTNWIGRRKVVNYADVTTVIQAALRLPARTLPMLFLLDGAGKRSLTMYGTLWPTDAMGAASAATGVAPTTFPGPISYRELRKLYPHAVSWARANPIALALILLGGFFIVLIAGLMVVFTVLMRQVNGL
jgi:hypothetical protein